jgi:anti-anti-sigma regulatory factor
MVENSKILTHLFYARKASLASGVPSFCSNISPELAHIVIQTDVTQAYLEW